MGGGDYGCGIGFLGVTSNKLVTFPRRNSIRPSRGLMLLHLGNVTIICYYFLFYVQ